MAKYNDHLEVATSTKPNPRVPNATDIFFWEIKTDADANAGNTDGNKTETETTTASKGETAPQTGQRAPRYSDPEMSCSVPNPEPPTWLHWDRRDNRIPFYRFHPAAVMHYGFPPETKQS